MGSSHLEKLRGKVHIELIVSRQNDELECCPIRYLTETTVLFHEILA